MPVYHENLKINSDLSDASYEQAVEDLRDMSKKCFRSLPDWDRFSYLPKLLVVQYFNVDTALAIMARHRNCEVKVVQHYAVDEWHVEITPPNTNDTYRVYSPGA